MAISKLQGLFRRGFFHILLGNFLNKAITMVFSLFIARLVTKEAYADLTYADNLYSYITLVSSLGLSSALLKYSNPRGSPELSISYFRYSLTCGSAIDLVVTAIVCVAVIAYGVPFQGARTLILSMVLLPPIQNMYNSIVCYLRTELKNQVVAYSGIIYSVCISLLGVMLFLFLGLGGIILSRYMSLVIVGVYGYLNVGNRSLLKTASKLDASQRRQYWSMAISLLIANVFSGIMPVNEVFLVNNVIRDTIATANFRVAGLFPQLLFLVSGAITVYFFPIVAQMDNKSKIRKLSVRIGILNAAILLVLAGLGVLLTPFLIKGLYGTKYADAIPLTYMLWAMRFANSAVRVVPMNIIAAIGKTKFNAVTAVATSLLQTALDYFLILRFGVSGVAVGALVAYSLSGVLYWWYLLKICKNN